MFVLCQFVLYQRRMGIVLGERVLHPAKDKARASGPEHQSRAHVPVSGDEEHGEAAQVRAIIRDSNVSQLCGEMCYQQIIGPLL